MLLANIGANSTVVAAGLLHDTVDDSFLTFDHISTTFGPGVADLVEGVRKALSFIVKDLVLFWYVIFSISVEKL